MVEENVDVMITVDSNIWIYYLDATINDHKLALDYVEDLIRHEEVLSSTIIWLEVSRYLYRTSSIPKEKLCDTLVNLLDFLACVL